MTAVPTLMSVDDPRFAAASMLADAWAPALDRSYRLGHANGHDLGRRDEQREQQNAWSAVARLVRAGALTPRQAELERLRRGDDHSPCPADCGTCSRCVHAAGWAARGGRAYQGAEAERIIAEHEQVTR